MSIRSGIFVRQMQTIAIIGCGAIAEAVAIYLANYDHIEISAALIEPGTDARARDVFGEAVEHGILRCPRVTKYRISPVGNQAFHEYVAASHNFPLVCL